MVVSDIILDDFDDFEVFNRFFVVVLRRCFSNHFSPTISQFQISQLQIALGNNFTTNLAGRKYAKHILHG